MWQALAKTSVSWRRLLCSPRTALRVGGIHRGETSRLERAGDAWGCLSRPGMHCGIISRQPSRSPRNKPLGACWTPVRLCLPRQPVGACAWPAIVDKTLRHAWVPASMCAEVECESGSACVYDSCVRVCVHMCLWGHACHCDRHRACHAFVYVHERVCEHVFTTPLCAGMCVHEFQCVYCM